MHSSMLYKLKSSLSKPSKSSQQIEVFDLQENTTTSYNSVSETARALNINQARIVMYFSRNQKKPYKGRYTFQKVAFLAKGQALCILVPPGRCSIILTLVKFIYKTYNINTRRISDYSDAFAGLTKNLKSVQSLNINPYSLSSILSLSVFLYVYTFNKPKKVK
jgi:hypothetical protein